MVPVSLRTVCRLADNSPMFFNILIVFTILLIRDVSKYRDETPLNVY